MTDYNQALTVTEAIRRGQALDGEGAYWIEEPTRHENYAGFARIAAALKKPVQIGKNFAGAPAMATALAEDACDYVMPDLERIVDGMALVAGGPGSECLGPMTPSNTIASHEGSMTDPVPAVTEAAAAGETAAIFAKCWAWMLSI